MVCASLVQVLLRLHMTRSISIWRSQAQPSASPSRAIPRRMEVRGAGWRCQAHQNPEKLQHPPGKVTTDVMGPPIKPHHAAIPASRRSPGISPALSALLPGATAFTVEAVKVGRRRSHHEPHRPPAFERTCHCKGRCSLNLLCWPVRKGCSSRFRAFSSAEFRGPIRAWLGGTQDPCEFCRCPFQIPRPRNPKSSSNKRDEHVTPSHPQVIPVCSARGGI